LPPAAFAREGAGLMVRDGALTMRCKVCEETLDCFGAKA
jgi:hypothetical protein